MFEDSLVESAALLRTRNRWPALFSITTQCAIALLIVSLPLLHPELIQMPHSIPAILVPPHLPAPAPPVELPQTLPRTSAIAVPAAVAAVATTAECVCNHPDPSRSAVDAPTRNAVNITGSAAVPFAGIVGATPAGPRVSVGSAAGKASSKPVNVSSGVSAGLLLAPIRPEYPQIARAAHVQGTVVIDAIISRTGTIESAHMLSGPPMLQQAALDAVRQAHYRPFLLNGQPTDVQTTITIVFRMGG
jgi:periplasmic protein TonB